MKTYSVHMTRDNQSQARDGRRRDVFILVFIIGEESGAVQLPTAV
jgi:hypothetical protein